MATSMTLDRFEGPDKQIAVLLGDDDLTLNVPRALLPAGAKPGDVLRLDLRLDADATAQVQAEARAVQAELKGRDPGGDLSL